jgi:hypothetical protein
VAELDSRAPRPRHGTETGQQDPGHGGAILGQLPDVRKAEPAPPRNGSVRREGFIVVGPCLDPDPRLRYPPGVHQLIDYLRQHLMIDFQGDLTVSKVRELLAGDDSRDTKVLMAKLVAKNSVEDMMLVLADCLLEHVQRSLTDDVVREQIRMYAES